ncbi:MAG: DUF2238 protein [Gammaproteobacteria bacterium]|nr:DUF2238 protein [Gammaproteobacteria bacterium]
MMGILKKGQLPILLVNAIALTAFSILFITRQNYEFLLYIGVIIFFLGLILQPAEFSALGADSLVDIKHGGRRPAFRRQINI